MFAWCTSFVMVWLCRSHGMLPEPDICVHEQIYPLHPLARLVKMLFSQLHHSGICIWLWRFFAQRFVPRLIAVSAHPISAHPTLQHCKLVSTNTCTTPPSAVHGHLYPSAVRDSLFRYAKRTVKRTAHKCIFNVKDDHAQLMCERME